MHDHEYSCGQVSLYSDRLDEAVDLPCTLYADLLKRSILDSEALKQGFILVKAYSLDQHICRSCLDSITVDSSRSSKVNSPRPARDVISLLDLLLDF